MSPLLWKFLLQEMITTENNHYFSSNGSSDVKCKKNGNVVYSGQALNSYLSNSQERHSNMETITIVSPLAHTEQCNFHENHGVFCLTESKIR